MATVEDADEPRAEPLSAAETALLEAVRRGRPLDPPDAQKPIDPHDPSSFGEERTIRAEVLRAALVGDGRNPPHRTVLVRGVLIDGVLDLDSTTLAMPLRFERCAFADTIDLREASVPALELSECGFGTLLGSGLKTRSDLDVLNSRGAFILLNTAHIGGQLTLDGSKLTGLRGPTESSSRATSPSSRRRSPARRG